MPPTRGAAWVGEIDGTLACYVVFSGDVFEVKSKSGLFMGKLASTVSFVKPSVGRCSLTVKGR